MLRGRARDRDPVRVRQAEPERVRALLRGMELHHLVDDPMYLALPSDRHALARKPRVRLKDVAGETWIQESGTHSWCGQFHETVCEAAGFDAEGRVPADDYNVVQGLSRPAWGSRCCPGSRSRMSARTSSCARSARRPARRIAAGTLAGRYRSPATSAMLEILSEVADRFELPSGATVAALASLVGATCFATIAASSPTPIRSRRLPLAQEVDADEVEPGHDGARAVALHREAEIVERLRPLDPRVVVGAEAAGEDDRPESGQVDPFGSVRVERRRLGSSPCGSGRARRRACRRSSTSCRYRSSPHATLAARSGAKTPRRPSTPRRWPMRTTPCA